LLVQRISVRRMSAEELKKDRRPSLKVVYLVDEDYSYLLCLFDEDDEGNNVKLDCSLHLIVNHLSRLTY
jgi:hypothetical protein